MNDRVIASYFEKGIKRIPIRKSMVTALAFAIDCAVKAKSFIPAHMGLQTTTAIPYNGIKRIGRLLSNIHLDRELIDEIYLGFLQRFAQKEITLAMDWTVIKEKYCFLSVSVVLGKGQGIPVYFTGYIKKHLSDEEGQTDIEKKTIEKIVKTLGKTTKITLLGDRGFNSPGFLVFLEKLKIKYYIRCSAGRYITSEIGAAHKLEFPFLKKGMSDKKYCDILYTKNKNLKCNIYIRWPKKNDEPWIILSNTKTSTTEACKMYATRWEIESMFKSLKNQDTGFSLKIVKLVRLDRWLRLLLIATITFQALGSLGCILKEDQTLQKRYSMSSKPPRKQTSIFSIFQLALRVVSDRFIELKYSLYRGFAFRLPHHEWIGW